MTNLKLNYRSAGAMRGPDVRNQHLTGLKLELTARARSMFYTAYECEGWYNSTTVDESSLEAINVHLTAIEQTCNANRATAAEAIAVVHYFSHLIDMLAEHPNHPVWGGHASVIRYRLESVKESVSNVAKEIQRTQKTFNKFGDC